MSNRLPEATTLSVSFYTTEVFSPLTYAVCKGMLAFKSETAAKWFGAIGMYFASPIDRIIEAIVFPIVVPVDHVRDIAKTEDLRDKLIKTFESIVTLPLKILCALIYSAVKVILAALSFIIPVYSKWAADQGKEFALEQLNDRRYHLDDSPDSFDLLSLRSKSLEEPNEIFSQ